MAIVERATERGPTARYRFISDPGHGWLEVPRSEVRELGLSIKVSSYSYQHKGMVYLEEDCDAPLFIEAMRERGIQVLYDEVHQDPTPIRNYAAYDSGART